MRLLLVLICILIARPAQPLEACPCQTQTCKDTKALEAITNQLRLIYNKTPQPKGSTRPEVQQLAPKLLKSWQQYNIRPELLMAMMAVESKFDVTAYNKASQDHGLLQINSKTAKLYGITDACLKDWRCNLMHGTIILKDLQAMPGFKVCTYNLGPRGRFAKHSKACAKYEAKVASVWL
jgi:hypothetical protein